MNKQTTLVHAYKLFFIGLAMMFTSSQTAHTQEKTREPDLDPQAVAFIKFASSQPRPSWEELGPDRAREGFNGLTDLFGSGPTEVAATDQKFDGRIPVRIYRPEASDTTTVPVIVYFHGGGWVLGNLDTHDALCRRLCQESHCAVVAVDYRLAPENPFPAPLDDCFDATKFVADHADQLKFDRTKLVVAGDSAGGNLAAAVALKARDKSGPRILAQVLIYPALDSRCNSTSYEAYAKDHGLSRADMQWFWQQYTQGKGPGTQSSYAEPAYATSLKELPQTLIVTAQYDVLRAEAETYAEKLKQAGVSVELIRYDGMIHGFIHFMAAFDKGRTATSDIASKIARLTTNR
jgi:acetyl esterase